MRSALHGGSTLASKVLQTVSTTLTVDSSTSSAVLAVLLTLSVTKIDTATKLLVTSTFAFSNSGVADTTFQLFVGGVAKSGAKVSTVLAGATSDSGAVSELISGVAAGAVTIELKWATSAGTSNIRPATQLASEHATLIVQEVA